MARLYLFVVMVAAALSSGCGSMPSGSNAYYVKDSVLDVRLAPSPAGTITNRIYRQQKVEVFEIKGEWARVSNFYDGTVEGKTGQVARWVLERVKKPSLIMFYILTMEDALCQGLGTGESCFNIILIIEI